MMHILRERSAKWNERKGNGTAMSFGDRLLNKCAGATSKSRLAGKQFLNGLHGIEETIGLRGKWREIVA